MMTILARLTAKLFGSTVWPIGLLLGALTMGHQWWLERDTRMKMEAAKTATQACVAEQQLTLVTAQLKAVKAIADKKDQEVEFERQVAEELRNEKKAIHTEYEQYKLAASADPRCLSDGVLDLLRRDGGSGQVGK